MPTLDNAGSTNFGKPDKNGYYPGFEPAGYNMEAVYQQNLANQAAVAASSNYAPSPAPAPNNGGAVFGNAPAPSQAPAPSTAAWGAAPAPGIIAGAIGAPSPAPSPAPASGGAAFGAAPAGAQAPASSGASFGGTTTGTPAPAPNAIRTMLDGQTWAGQGKDAVPVQTMYNQAVANGWTPEQIGAEIGQSGDWVRSLYTQYGYTWPANTPAPGAPPAPPAPGAPPASGGIISNSMQSQQLGNPTPWNVTDDQTVEGRLARFNDPNNPIIARARAGAADRAAAMGLSNSSMALTAGDAAAYDAAMPVAQADAATFAKAAGYDADQKNQFTKTNADYENQFRLQDKANAAQKDIALINRDTQLQIGKMNIDAQTLANKLQTDNQLLLKSSDQAAQAFNQATAVINNINLSTTMDANHKTAAVANVWHDVQTQLKVLSSVSDMNLSSQLNFSNYPGFDSQGNWVGVDATTGTNFGPAAGAAPAPSAPPDQSSNPGDPGYVPVDYGGAGA